MKRVGMCLLATASVFATFLVAVSFPGCSTKKEVVPVAVGELQTYRDPGFGFQFLRPKDWVEDAQVGRVRFYNAEGVSTKFLEPEGNYPDGVELAVEVKKTTSPAEDMKSQVAEMKAMNMQVEPDQPTTIGGRSATKVAYVGRYTKQVTMKGYHIYVEADTLLYDIGARGFGDLMQVYKNVLDTCIASFQFPKPVPKGVDPTLPSETFTSNDAHLFTFEYPDNFNFVNVPKGNNELVVSLRGVRQDCSVLFNVFGAKGLDVQKVFDQNKGRYAGASIFKTTLGGVPALGLTYSASRDVERRFIFAVKDDKVYRVTLDWYKPQREKYLAAYDKVISSFKFK